ncbi:transposase [Nonomuraea phyllanthi]|uniref:transposase n=1 Tax=Nonomuraea phyllanthi TaxID=2219224 RepID=UPI00129360E3|nr:transposase [Nonomuraea phyllanthi]QFY07931.1 transposase [Nonomuraea phyllanthi]
MPGQALSKPARRAGQAAADQQIKDPPPLVANRIGELDARIAQVSSRVDECIAPFTDQAARLDGITGIGVTSAQEVIAEIGVTMTVFPTARHLAS